MDADERLPNPIPAWARWLLLALILAAFARLLWTLGARNLWWDESLTLQRAEESLGPLLRGRLLLWDGVTTQVTTDQHPFLYFLLTGGLIRLAGTSEFVLRWVSVTASTLMVPTAWAFARGLARRRIVPLSAPLWAAGLAASSPFFLWYGQEARPYMLWAWLALLSTYLLWRGLEGKAADWRWLIGYAVTLPLFLASHYFALFLLPVHMALVLARMARRRPGIALLAALLVGGAGLLAAVYGYTSVMGQAGAGSNFASIRLKVLLPDLLNAFSLGLSVDISRVWPLDLFMGALALAGAIWGMRKRASLRAGGWLLPASVLVPVLALYTINLVRPLYMNARHMSLVSGFFLILVGAGLGWLWGRWRWLGGVAGALVLAGMLYSTVNYYTLPQYGKPDYAGMGAEMRQQIQPGDLVLLNSPLLWRIFHYYLPIDEVEASAAAGMNTAWRGVPLLNADWAANEAALQGYRDQYRRIWVARSGVNSFLDPEGRVPAWIQEHLFPIREDEFYNPTSVLELDLYLPGPPIRDDLPADLPHRLEDVVFGDLIQLNGYEVGQPLTPESVTPVTLYWTPVKPVERRYKYILQLEQVNADGSTQVLATTEREPYNGFLPTSWWTPGPYIFEYSDLPVPADLPADADLRLTLQLYDLETGEKLPVTQTEGVQVAEDGVTVILPYP